MEKIPREQHKAALIAEITAAFDGVARGIGVTLHQAQAHDEYAGDYEIEKARALDTEDRWQDVPAEHIAQSHDVLHYLDAQGFRYYIPAFLIWFLTTEGYSGNHHQIEFTLEYIPADIKRKHSRLSLLSLQQSRAIARFCVFGAGEKERERQEAEAKLDAQAERGGITPQDLEAERERRRQCDLDFGGPDNALQDALDRYWGQFL